MLSNDKNTLAGVTVSSELIERLARKRISIRKRGLQDIIKHGTPQWLVIMLCKGGIPDEFLRQMRFYHKHDQQKENDPDNKPTTASHTSPPFLI
ncbi:hypothetical protein M069_0934 [Bacteroides fragilis str. B1 (UDC16-1)]|nr:hypothetical protein M069_0934 [Bacteroides fragilis str. B1 (UDC16-1)]